MKRIFSILIISTLIFFSCKKDNADQTIPYVPVNTSILLSLPQYSNLNSVGGYSEITGGYRGIIVFKRSISEYVAYDLACPYDPTTEGALLQVDSSGITMIDSHCGSRFNLYDGSITKGPSTRPMKVYNTQYDSGSNSILITN